MSFTKSQAEGVNELLGLSNKRLQSEVLKVLRESGQASMARERVVKAIAKAHGVRQLKGSFLEQFRKHVNAAIGVLLKRQPAVVVRHGTTNSAIAPARKPGVNPSPRARLWAAVRDRVVALVFPCSECGRQIEVTALDEEGWCDNCLRSYYE